jgi:hypothetical protein
MMGSVKRSGNQAEVRSVRFKCGRQGCGSTEVRRWCAEHEEAEMWRAGDPLSWQLEIPDLTYDEMSRRGIVRRGR